MEAQSTLRGQEVPQLLHPLYRVHFWERAGSDYAWNLDAWVLTDCTDAETAIAWGRENAAGRRFQLFVLATYGDTSNDLLVHLYGDDPNAPEQR